jgi:GntR family transcriptional regulator, vanillate catabolism transcriptional regulator
MVRSSSSVAPPASQTDRVVLTLREMVITGEFSPGERLTELGLVLRLKASRTPVRHALARLAHEGILEPVPTGGYRARAFTLDEIWDAIEIRGVLEGTAARLAAERLSNPAELAALRACCEAMDAITPTTAQHFARYLELNDVFHRELVALAKSSMLLRTLEGVLALPFAAPGALVFGEAEALHSLEIAHVAREHHRAIVEAIEHREGARAESLAREHSRVARKNLARALEDTDLLKRVPGASLIRLSRAI